MSKIIDLIRDAMQKQGVTVYQLSKHTSMSQQTLHNIMERGDLKISQLVSIAQALGISPSKLLEETDSDISTTAINQVKTIPKIERKGEIDYLKALLQEKERVIDMQNEMISLLKAQAG